MATAATFRQLAARLESEVSRHGCGSPSCSLCQDREDCLTASPPAKPRPVPLPAFSVVRRVDVPGDARGAPIDAHDVVFDGQLPCY